MVKYALGLLQKVMHLHYLIFVLFLQNATPPDWLVSTTPITSRYSGQSNKPLYSKLHPFPKYILQQAPANHQTLTRPSVFNKVDNFCVESFTNKHHFLYKIHLCTYKVYLSLPAHRTMSTLLNDSGSIGIAGSQSLAIICTLAFISLLIELPTISQLSSIL